MTNGEIYKLFKEKYPDIKISDYRPLANMFIPKTEGITIWTSEGDVILYFPKEGERKYVSTSTEYFD